MIPYGRQHINQADIDAVVEVLRSDFLTQGPKVPIFEGLIAKHVGAKHAVATNSATSALHISCLALGLGKNDWLWTSPVTFVASSNVALYCGANVDFVDIDPLTNNLSIEALKKKLEDARQKRLLPKVVMPVHLAGNPCDMSAIYALSIEYGFKVIEDASHAIGSKYKNSPVGSGIYSDITVFSFHPVKIITTGEGGMAVTNDPIIAHNLELLRSHGITRDSRMMVQEPHGPWYYEQIALGFNYRMTELQAALGISQLDRLDYFVEIRNQIACRYNKLLKNLPLTIALSPLGNYSSYHLYIVRLKLNSTDKSHLEIFQALRDHGVGVNLHYIPVHLQPYYRKLGFMHGDFPQAEKYYQEAISLPIFPSMTTYDQDCVINALHEVLDI
jgi:UDP-4-amino-4,6-dideoxy-N-acetyl-beta-L-altrosamine transaminase